jgi:ribosomal-protein-alanine N-acetyltransferase
MERAADIPLIETERLRLSIPPATFAPQMVAYLKENREHFAPWSPPEPPDYYTENFWRERLDAAQAEFKRGQSMRLVMTGRNDSVGRILGDCNFTNFVRGPFQACYLGYKLAQAAQGQGLMYEALTAAIRYAFDDLKLHRIMANYVPANERSGRLLRRLGFVVEGYAYEYLLIDGAWRDHLLTSLTNTKLRPEDVR